MPKCRFGKSVATKKIHKTARELPGGLTKLALCGFVRQRSSDMAYSTTRSPFWTATVSTVLGVTSPAMSFLAMRVSTVCCR